MLAGKWSNQGKFCCTETGKACGKGSNHGSKAQKLVTVVFLPVFCPSRPYTNFKSTLVGRVHCELIYILGSLTRESVGQELCTGDTWRSIKTWRAWIPWVGYITRNGVTWRGKEEWHLDNQAPPSALWFSVTTHSRYFSILACIGGEASRRLWTTFPDLSLNPVLSCQSCCKQYQKIIESKKYLL